MEEWRKIEGSSYEVSNTGKTRELGKAKILRKKINSRGYYYVCLYLNGRYSPKEIHILVSRAFLGEPEKPKLPIKHIDGDKLNNNIENLEYSTVKEMSLAYWKAEKSSRKTTPKHIVIQIRDKAATTSAKQLAAEFNLHYVTVYRIISGKRCKFY